MDIATSASALLLAAQPGDVLAEADRSSAMPAPLHVVQLAPMPALLAALLAALLVAARSQALALPWTLPHPLPLRCGPLTFSISDPAIVHLDFTRL